MEKKQVPHVLIFPFPVHGHINPMLKVAELLCMAGLRVTFLNTEHNQQLLLNFTDAMSRFNQFPHFRFQAISDGISDDRRSKDVHLLAIYDAINTVIKPAMRDLLISEEWPPVTCIVGDATTNITIDVAKEFGIPNIAFHVLSAASVWTYLCIQKLIQEKELPFKDDDLDQRITCVPGMESFLRRRDLPSFFRTKDLDDPCLQSLKNIFSISMQSSALIFNTIDELEEPFLSQIESLAHSKVYTIGPLSALLSSEKTSTSSTSLWAVDRSCLTWLDSQAKKSVIYVCFGTIALMTADQFLEFWYGLVNSGKPFLWVTRPDSIIGERKIPKELLEATKERGYIIDWSPQEEVLKHPSIGGFLTHNGWNATLEAITAGVPMLCWPYFGDQYVHSRLVEVVWKNGIDMKDTCDRLIIEKLVRDLMEERKDEFMKSSEKMAEMVKKSVAEGGSSSRNFNCLVADIFSMSL